MHFVCLCGLPISEFQFVIRDAKEMHKYEMLGTREINFSLEKRRWSCYREMQNQLEQEDTMTMNTRFQSA